MYIIQVLTLALCACVPVTIYNDLSVMDESHYYPNEGIYLEPAGQYLSHAGVIIIPYVYILPNIQVIHTAGCPGYRRVLSTYLNVLEHIKTITYSGSYSHHYNVNATNKPQLARDRRSLFPIVSVLSGGLSVWNTIEIQGIKQKVNNMRQNMEHIDSSLQSIVSSQNKIIDRVGEISILVSDHSRIINKMYDITHCLHQDQEEFIDIVSKWLYIAPIEFINAYSGAISGSITPSLLSATNLRQIVFNHKEMEGTLYLSEPSIVYELGKVLVTDIQVNDIAYIKGIIQLPRIMAMNPLPMYNIYTVNIIKNGLDIIYDLPSVLVCPNVQTCWKPDYEKCTHKSSRLLCIYGANTYPDSCLTNLYNNNTEKCKYKIRKHISPIAIQTGSGILLGGSKTDHKIFKRISNIDIPSNVINKRDDSILITPEQGDWISINDNIYNTKISGFEYNYTIYITSSNISQDIDHVRVGTDWKDLEKVIYRPLDVTDFAYNNSLIIVLCILCLSLTLGLVYIYMKFRSYIKLAHLTKVSQGQEFIGLR